MTNLIRTKATKINLLDFKTPQMRAFHFTWFAFFMCFFGWFAFPALSKWVIEDLGIDKKQFVTTSQWAVGSTILMRLFIGWLSDKIGPRKSYTWILLLGSIPVFLSAFVQNYEQLLLVRVFIGAIGASFVITQFHTSLMFAPNIVGTANATAAGWGNLGGGVTQQVMPLLLLSFAFFMPEEMAWRYAMAVPAVIMLITGLLYSRLTTDTPNGDYATFKKNQIAKKENGTFLDACKDYRVWILFLMYGSCFGIELIVNSNMALYLTNDIKIDPYVAGTIAALFGLMNLFARTLGGVFGDRFGRSKGLNGRAQWLFFTIFFQGLFLILFSRINAVLFLIPAMIVFSLFVQMAEGATFSVVPFVNKKVVGAISGIVGAGGNAGAVLGMFLFKIDTLAWNDAFLILGGIVTVLSFSALLIRFSKAENDAANKELEEIKKFEKTIEDTEEELEPAMELN